MTFFITVGLMIVLNTVLYYKSKKQVILWSIGFMCGLYFAKLIEAYGVGK